jgi:hypothetical protein
MAGLVPAIHVFATGKTWMPGTSLDKPGHDDDNYSLISPRLTLSPSFASMVFFARPAASISTA